MKVKELIEELQKHDGEIEVKIEHEEVNYTDIERISKVKDILYCIVLCYSLIE